MTRGIVVTGTDTGVGKTVVCAALLAMLARVLPAPPRRYWKPVQTGWPTDDDAAEVARLARLTPEQVIPSAVRLAMPASPFEAARAEGVVLTPPWALPPIPDDAVVVVEGAGGLLVPFDEATTFADLFVAWGLPLWIVARPEVGTLNHTLLTIEAARRRGLEVDRVVVSREPTRAVMDAIRTHGRVDVLVIQTVERNPESIEAAGHALLGARQPPSVIERLGIAGAMPDLVAKDGASVWHPYTQHGLGREPLSVASAKGAWLHLHHAEGDRGGSDAGQPHHPEGDHMGRPYGNRVIDGVSSWWTCLHGHGNEAIADAIAHQARSLDHVQFGGLTHAPAVVLAERLLKIAPTGLERVFYSDDGSTAVETALKMAVAFHARRGAPERTKVIALEGGYHGDTAGAMSVSADSVFTRDFRSMRFDVFRVPPPVRGRRESECVAALEELLDREGPHVAAMIVEPLVLAAGGMLVYGESYLRAVRRLATKHGVLLIADEVFTGFGRTGAMFGCERANVSPDLLCLSKALTGGTLPLAATLSTASIYAAFLSDRTEDAFLHGHSYTANPIACAAALASLDLLDEKALARASAIGERLETGLSSLRGDPRVKDLRGIGLVRAVEVDAGGGRERGYVAEAGRRMADAALERGVFLRPLGDVLYAMPPLRVTDAEVDQIAEAMVAAVRVL